MKSWGVEVVVFPPHLTDVIQPLDKAVFRALKASFGSAVKRIDSAKEKVPPCTAAVRLPQPFTQKNFSKFFIRDFFFQNFLCTKNGMYTQKNTLLSKERWFSFGHGIQIGDE